MSKLKKKPKTHNMTPDQPATPEDETPEELASSATSAKRLLGGLKRPLSLKRSVSWKNYQLIGSAIVFAIIGGYFIITSFATSPSGQANLTTPATKHLRPITHHKDKAVCATAAKGSNKVQCFARQLVNNDGSIFRPTPPKEGKNGYSSNYSSTNPNATIGSQTGMGPVEFHTAYNLPCKPGGPVQTACDQPSSFGPTIAIVDAYDIGTRIESDLATFDQQFNLPTCTIANGCLTILNQDGQTSPLPCNAITCLDQTTRNSAALWSEEAVLDIETVHEICQTCAIKLVESNTNSYADMAAAENAAANLSPTPVAISNSFGGSQSQTRGPPYASAYNHPGVAIVAASGDFGKDSQDPAGLASVIAVGGTSLYLNTDNTWANENYWQVGGAGGWDCSRLGGFGYSDYQAPLWQTQLPNWNSTGYYNIYSTVSYIQKCAYHNQKGIADVSADADPNSGGLVFNTWPNGGGWGVWGGTSLSAPIIAGIFGLTGGLPSGYSQPAYIPYSENDGTHFRDINDGGLSLSICQTPVPALGNSSVACGFVAPGYDLETGLGTPNGIGGFIANGQPPVTSTCPPGTIGTPPNCTSSTPDTTPPSTASSLTASIASASSASVSWQASTDNIGVVGYYVYRNNTNIAKVSINAYADTALKANSNYSYYVIAYDKAGNKSGKSVAVSFKTPSYSTTNGSITGRVVDEASSKPLSGVKVYYVLGGRYKNVSTNSSGYYVINNLPPTSYSLSYSLTNYYTQLAPVSTTAGANTNQDINLYHL